MGQDHIEIESLEPKRARLPITETGYRSHFLSGEEIAHAGGAVALVNAWLTVASDDKAWLRAQVKAAQGDLFAWADAMREVAGKSQRGPKRSALRPRKTARKDRAPG